MSDTIEETPEREVVGDYQTIRVAGRDYLFERTEHGTLIYVGYAPPVIVVDEDEPKPFDPSEYR